MKDLIDKLRFIYIPFIITAVGTICGYLFLFWLLMIKLHLFSYKKEMVELWIPVGFSLIAMIVWLRPRIKLLGISESNYRYESLPYLFGAAAILIPCLIGVNYIEKASGVLTSLENISQINKRPPTKYYSLKNYFIDKKDFWNYNTTDISGKRNEYLDMNIFMVLPIIEKNSDTIYNKCSAWLAIKYHDQVSNPHSDAAIDNLFHEFYERSMLSFASRDVQKFTYLELADNNSNFDCYYEAAKNSPKFKSPDSIFLLPNDEPFETRTGSKLMWIFLSFGIGSLNWFLMLLIPRLNHGRLEKFKSGKLTNKNDYKAALFFFLPRKDFFITPIIIDLNILIFLMMVFSGMGVISFKSEDLLIWGADYRPYTMNGEWWRMLTNIFLHGGLMHIFANMVGLLFVGIILEPRLGRIRYAVVYLVTGVLASAASLWWHDASVSVGASGAIFGLYGVFLALLLTKVFPKDFSKPFLATTLIFVGYNLLVGLTGGIDNAAHIGGLLSGLIIGFFLSLSMPKEKEGIKFTK